MNEPPNREEAIFDAALQLADVAERAAHLDCACAGDAALRRRVEVLLRSHDQAGEFLQPDAVGHQPGVKRTAAAEETIGAVIGRYKLLEKVGEGGFGAVYVAEQREPVKRRVALKIIKLGMDTRQVVARFEAERQALAMMDHPNIAKILDAGVAADSGISNLKSEIPRGRPFFVMELVRGIKFTDYCDQNKLSTKERLELFIKVCQAIQHAHQKGIIHRDLKPSNILVTLHDGVPVPKVIDFGIAKATQGDLTDKTVYTNFQQFIGTPAYMSPEQAEMSGLDVDTRSDIYSLGVLLYELLTGRTPFEQKELLEAGLDRMRQMIREREPVPPSTRVDSLKKEERTTTAARRGLDAPKLIHQLRGDLDWIVLKCLEKDRTRRYETANGLAMDIQRYLANEPIVARPPSKRYRFQKLVRRNKLAFVAATVTATALVLGAVVSAWQAVRATRARQQAEAISRFLRDDLLYEATPDKSAAAELRAGMQAVLKKASAKLDQGTALEHQPEIEAALRLAIGNTYFKLGLLTEADRELRRAVALSREALGPHHPDTLNAREDLAWFVIEGLKNFREGEELSRDTWQARRAALGAEHRDTLNSMDTYAGALASQGKLGEAETLLRRCLAIRERVLGTNDSDTLTSVGNLGLLLIQRDALSEAEQKLRDVLGRRDRLGLQDKADTFAVRNNLALALLLQGRGDEAQRIVTDALNRARVVFGLEHPNTLHLQHVQVRILADAGQLDQAEVLARQTLEIHRRGTPPGHEATGRTLLYLGRVLVEQGKLDDAEPLLREALKLFQENYPMKPELALQAANWLGAIQLARGNYAEAKSLLLPNAELILEPTAQMSAIEQRAAIGHLIKLYEALGEREPAARWQKQLAALARSRSPAANP